MATAQATTQVMKSGNIIRRGDFTKERHEKTERSAAEVDADILRLQALHPERLTIEPTDVDAEMVGA